MAAATNSSQEFDPRHRIVGAIIIVLLVVVFVPLLLGDPEELSRHAGEGLTGSEQQADGDVKRYVTHLSGRKNIDSEPVKQGKAARSSTSAKTSGWNKSRSGAAAKNNAISGGKWELRIGTFSKPENARNLMKGLKKLKFDVRSSNTTKGYTRVWMGAYSSEDEARKMRQKLEKLARVKAIVVRQ